MEIVLALQSNGQVAVICNGRLSHSFDFAAILPEREGENYVLKEPIQTGKEYFKALFPQGTLAKEDFEKEHVRMLLVSESDELDAVPWEYIYGPDGFLVLDVAFVRGIPEKQRKVPPDLHDATLYIVAIPSNPISHNIVPLDINGEWQRLKETIQGLGASVTLERVRPPPLEQTRRLVANQKQRVVHFMGHGGLSGKECVLIFEDDHGAPKRVTAQEFIRRMADTTFLITLNACGSATPGEAEFSNLAQSLVVHGIPYALGMRFSILDEDAKIFSRTFYDELTRGTNVENALRQARNSLAESKNPWAVGTPVLYTSLSEPSHGFITISGQPIIEEHQVPLDLFVLPKAEGAFQGRVDELLELGKALTDEPRVKLLTIHGTGGQGKTALAREAIERFAHAWPGGVWAISLETKPDRSNFGVELAKFLEIPLEKYPQTSDLEREILHRLEQRRTLVVLDNAETFTEAVIAQNPEALDLAAFLKERLLGTSASLLVTSREPLGWANEAVLPLDGLSPQEGAALFRQSAPQRQSEIEMALAEQLSRKLDGHPLALILLGLAFNEAGIPLEQFIAEHEERLMKAENKYKAVDHRHRTLFASIETSVRYLEEEDRSLLSQLWVFRAPFLPDTLVRMEASDQVSVEKSKIQKETILERLVKLQHKGLLVSETATLPDGNILLYRCLPTIRLYARMYLNRVVTEGELQRRLAANYANLLMHIYDEIDRSTYGGYLAVKCRADFESCAEFVEESEKRLYLNCLGWVLQRIGDWESSLRWLEKALELVEGENPRLEVRIFNNLGEVYQKSGKPEKALDLFAQALMISAEIGDRAGEGATLSNMAIVYRGIGQHQKALELYEKALPIRHEVEDKAGEASTLNNVALIYQVTGHPEKALEMYERALQINREVKNRIGEAAALNNMARAYQAMGHFIKTLELCKQALQIQLDLGDRLGEATTLITMGMVYRATGRPVEALRLYKQALQYQREIGNRGGEASALNNMALVCRDTEHSGAALELFEQALPIMIEIRDRPGEGTILNNMAELYVETRCPEKALELFEQALTIMREVGNRNGEASTLNNMAWMYQDAGHPEKALELYKQALLIVREVRNLAGEATTLGNMAYVYRATDHLEKALELLKNSLSILTLIGNRFEVASTLNNMAGIHRDAGHLEKAIELYEQALSIRTEVGDRAGAAIVLFNLVILTRGSGKIDRAMDYLRRLVELEKTAHHTDYRKHAAILALWEAELQKGEL
jgi:tetratricopeptide (TPR) repeat protein